MHVGRWRSWYLNALAARQHNSIRRRMTGFSSAAESCARARERGVTRIESGRSDLIQFAASGRGARARGLGAASDVVYTDDEPLVPAGGVAAARCTRRHAGGLRGGRCEPGDISGPMGRKGRSGAGCADRAVTRSRTIFAARSRPPRGGPMPSGGSRRSPRRRRVRALRGGRRGHRFVSAGLEFGAAPVRRADLDGVLAGAVEYRTPAEVAAELATTPNAVRQAKSRVLRRLKDEMGDVIV